MRFQFEDYVLDTDRRELRRGTEVVPIAPRVFDLLAHLIRNRERVVSKDDLIGAVWDGRIVSELGADHAYQCSSARHRRQRREAAPD